MARLEINRSGEMEVFTRVVDLGGFSHAARAVRMTPSAVSKLIARMEHAADRVADGEPTSNAGCDCFNRHGEGKQISPAPP